MAMNNSLAEVRPELVSEWSEKNIPLTPDDITFGSNKKVWWKKVLLIDADPQGDLTTCLGWQDTDGLGITLATKLTDSVN